MKIPIKIDEEIIGVKILFFFQYKLNYIHLDIETMVLIDTMSHHSASQLDFYGEIKFEQKDLLPFKGFREDGNNFEDNLINNEDNQAFNLLKFIQTNLQKNCE